MTDISLSDILAAREERVRLQKEIIDCFHCPIISFTMNIAGPRKNSALIRRAFKIGIDFLDDNISQEKILFKHIDLSNKAGPLAIYAVDATPRFLKKICIEAEEKTALGRLFDMDVIDLSFEKLSRERERGCIVCGAPGRACAAGRLHSVDEIVAKMNQIMTDGVLEYDANRFSLLVKDSLIREVRTTPKPGLVDLRNNGSHKDMTVRTFEDSANALVGYFNESFIIGNKLSSSTSEALFLELRKAGIEAEKTMYQVTGGVNTHKGAIFSFGIICGALGSLWTPERPIPHLEELLGQASNIAKCALLSDFKSPSGLTAGERMYISLGLTGIRGEAASGFRSVKEISLPIYSQLLNEGLMQNNAGVITLLRLIATINDTAIYNRGGMDGLSFARTQAKDLLQKKRIPEISEIESVDDIFIQNNLSAGGSADLLAITYFLYELNKIATS